MKKKKPRQRGPGGRNLKTRVRTAKGRKSSSTRWLQRQLNDPYVAQAGREGYRSRSAYKLIQLDEKFSLLKPGQQIVELGAAPGGWTQVAVARAGARGGAIIAVDMAEMEPLAGAMILRADFLDEATPALIGDLLKRPADLVLSDLAPVLSGHAGTDHLRIVDLVDRALEFAAGVLAPGGCFVAKVFQGGTERDLLTAMKRDFARVSHAKPPASRPESSEIFVVAKGFRGGAKG